jgi:hypothetical protein
MRTVVVLQHVLYMYVLLGVVCMYSYRSCSYSTYIMYVVALASIHSVAPVDGMVSYMSHSCYVLATTLYQNVFVMRVAADRKQSYGLLLFFGYYDQPCIIYPGGYSTSSE